MRRATLLFLLTTIVVLSYAVHTVWTLLLLLVTSGVSDAITLAELPSPDSTLTSDRTQPIPKILHQTYKTAILPEKWREAQQSCIDLHTPEQGWSYRLWTDDDAETFIAKEYPWFLATFTGYRYPIQRADAIRYFVLYHFGGVYLDLDDGCNRSLDPLLAYPAFVRKTNPTGISNDVMGAEPGHPFFERITREIESYDRSWVLPYITVMGSTGPLFLSVIWRHWIGEGKNVGDGAGGGRVRIVFPEEYQGQSWSFFTHHLGNSWHGYDVELIFWMAKNWILVTVLGFALGFSILGFCWFAYRRLVGQSNPDPLARRRAASPKGWLNYWRQGGERGAYELVDRHEV